MGIWCVAIRCTNFQIAKKDNKMNKLKIKDYTSNALYTVLVAVLLWMAVSSLIQAFKCTNITQTQLFLHILKSFVCDWQHCV
jgi:hypothetical protein